jgi:hypothetical protein
VSITLIRVPPTSLKLTRADYLLNGIANPEYTYWRAYTEANCRPMVVGDTVIAYGQIVGAAIKLGIQEMEVRIDDEDSRATDLS